MELVYLWVKKYKNIEKQGFNFSPRFHCTFHDEYELDENGKEKLKENCKLEIKPKEYTSIFPPNINITAIVGKNGSGKSTVIKILYEILQLKDYKAKILDESSINYLLVYKKNDKWQKFSNIDFTSDINIRKNEYIDFEHYGYLSNEQIYISDHGMFAEDYEIDVAAKDRIYLNKYLIAKMIASNILNTDLMLTTFMYVPKKLEVVSTKSSFSKYISKQRNNLEDKNSIDKFDHMVDESFKKTSPYEQFVREWYIMYYDMGIESCHVGVADKQYNIDADEIEEFKKHDCFLTEEEYEKYFQKQSKHFSELVEKDKQVYFNWYKDEFEFDFIDLEDRRFNDLSHGEQTIFGLFLNLYYLSVRNKNKPITYLLDEPDLSLHPEWQRKYISELEALLQRLQSNFQILFTSHSPFLLSDLPKENIIFLDTDENGNCKVVDGLKDKKETFGANIHTLLSDSFFMEEGLMGEFAKGKIDKVITFLNQEKLSADELKYCEQIISIIGEPIIKNQLQRMLDSKRLKKVDEIDAIKKSMEAMQKRLDELEK